MIEITRESSVGEEFALTVEGGVGGGGGGRQGRGQGMGKERK